MTLIKLLMTWKLKWVNEAYQHGAWWWLSVNEHQCICSHHQQNRCHGYFLASLLNYGTRTAVSCWLNVKVWTYCVLLNTMVCRNSQAILSGVFSWHNRIWFIRIWYEFSGFFSDLLFDGFVQERRNSIADALELRLPCTNPSICHSCFLNINEYRPSITVFTGACRLKSPAARPWFGQQPVQANKKKNNHRIIIPLWEESTDDQ